MWKKRLGWSVAGVGAFFVFTLAVGTVTSLKPAEGAVLVSDVNNTIQNSKTAISTATTAINTATQITNQNKNLASMSSDGLLDHYVSIAQELATMTGATDAYAGLLTTSKTTDQAWGKSFTSVDDIFNATVLTTIQKSEASKTTLSAQQNTYKDSMNIAKIIVNSTDESGQELQTSLNRSANAVGAKEALQANAQVNSIGVQENIKTNALLANLIVIEAGKNQGEAQEKAQAISEGVASINNFKSEVTSSAANLKSSSDTVDAYPPSLAKYYK